MSGGGSTGSSNTVTSVQQIPEFEQAASQNNQQLAQSIGSQPYPTYNAPLIQGMDPLQTQGQNQAIQASTSYQPYLTGATNLGNNVTQAASNASALSNPNAVSAYMSPYIQQSLQPQIQDLQTQLAQQQQGINQQATQANAFGDARQGAASALQNYYGDQALNGLVSQGYNTAYNTALGAANSAAQTQLGAGNLYGQEQNAYSTLGQLQQQLGLSGANAVYAAGAQNQQLGQSQLNAAYQQYLNQVNWPVQMLNVQESALSNSPYNVATAVTLPNANSTAQGFGTATGLAGLLGSLGSTQSNTGVFGGSALRS